MFLLVPAASSHIDEGSGNTCHVLKSFTVEPALALLAADDDNQSIQTSYPCPRLAFEDERSKLQLMLPACATV